MVLGQQARFWLLNCCVSPQSEIARVRIDRSMIGQPTNFRHIGHMGTNDLSSAFSIDEASSLLRSKGGDVQSSPTPDQVPANDIPVKGSNVSWVEITEASILEVKIFSGLGKLADVACLYLKLSEVSQFLDAYWDSPVDVKLLNYFLDIREYQLQILTW
ncbi:unnamed protein product [Enterobius vermicularis]|uniref:CRIB domain-containing protein n=1 Tax=Enterobius vermicularis TaxID=51028 RepID=A0A0N4UX80_ENTVE|nr:unnamed protein product [Enterobius vermicularis]